MFSSIDRVTAETQERYQQFQNLVQKYAFLRPEVILSMDELNLDQAPQNTDEEAFHLERVRLQAFVAATDLGSTRGLLATDHVILNHGQVTWTTPELAPPLLTTTLHQREDISALDRFNVHRCPTRRVFSGTGLEPVTKQATQLGDVPTIFRRSLHVKRNLEVVRNDKVSSTSLDHGTWSVAQSPRVPCDVNIQSINQKRGPYCQVIYSQFGLAIHQNDHQARRRFVEWAQNEIAVAPDFHKRILFSDEAHFWLNGYVNKQNCRIWSEANPQVYVETTLHPEKLTVWCALRAGGIIGPYFFKNYEGHNVTVNGDRYRAMITNFFIPELNNHDVQELWFQQDGATCHTARATIDLLKDTFGDRLISRFGPVNWPPRSCDLPPLDYFLWGYVKSLVYANKPQTLDYLEDNIRRVIADIRPQMLKNSSKIGRPDWTTSKPAVAVLCQKSYLKCNATRLSFE
ncbi:uncharacterized protein TNCV_3244421 [Trichonephila clavipes]|nr:uncharacterized protein TNCV_3244421 [Trichonephila clavipes]